MGKVPDDPCAIARSLGVLGERWTLLILREASQGAGRFSQFRAALGVAPDVLAEGLSTLVAHGVMEKVPYQEPGERAACSSRPSSVSGRCDLSLVRNAHGVIHNVNENFVLGNGSRPRRRYQYAYALFSASGFIKRAQASALGQQISLVDASCASG